jgi:asparagine synthetase B (glutamine-hydrolysing)
MNSLLRELSASVAARVALSPYTSPAAPPVSLHAERKARIAILFSGGLDCTTLALLADDQLAEGEEIDLMNVGFENPRVLRSNDPVPRKKKTSKAMRKLKNVGEAAAVVDVIEEREEEDNCAVASSIYDVPDRLTGLASSRELQSLRPNRTWNFVQVNVTYTEMLEHRMKVLELMRPQKTIMDLASFIPCFIFDNQTDTD